jgi:AraC-like DNA-binding protein
VRWPTRALADRRKPRRPLDSVESNGNASFDVQTVDDANHAPDPEYDDRIDAPCYSARFIQPFARLLADYEAYPAAALRALNEVDPDSRIPMHVAHQLAFDQVRCTGDVALGLKAARLMPFGSAGPLTYALHSAATVRQAIEIARRYAHLFCDGLTIELDVERTRSIVRFASVIPVPRTVADFAMSCWFIDRGYSSVGREAKVECWFSWSKPEDTTEYDRTFTQANLRFGAPFDGFALSNDYLESPLPGADSTLHVLFCQHLDEQMDRLARRQTFAGSIRGLAVRDLTHETPSAAGVAKQLGISVRTLNRRLEREGTSFRNVLDQLRQELALRYVGTHDIPLSEVSARLSFSHPEAFFRAFKRWTGESPLAYRRARRLQLNRLWQKA